MSAPPSSSFTTASTAARANRRTFTYLVLPIAILLRVSLAYFLHVFSYHGLVSSRLELTNAIVSFRSVRESLAHLQRPLETIGVDALTPYAGLSCSHATPIVLWVMNQVITVPMNAVETVHGWAYFISTEHLALLSVFTLMDLLTGWMIFRITEEAYRRPTAYLPRVMTEYLLQMYIKLPVVSSAVFLLNPFTVASCAIFNLNGLTQMMLALVLFSALRGKFIAATIALAISVYLDFYPLIIVVPVCLLLHRARYGRSKEYPQYRLDKFIDHDACRFVGEPTSDGDVLETEGDVAAAEKQRAESGSQFTRILKVVYRPIALPQEESDDDDQLAAANKPDGTKTKSKKAHFSDDVPIDTPKWNLSFFVLCFIIFTSVVEFLLFLSYLLSGSSFSFLLNSYGYSFTLPSLSPTYSLFWYFFTSIFDRFHGFFLVIFHAHILVYLIPLIVRLWEEPLFLATILLHLTTIFKAYPIIPEYMFTGTLLVLVNLPLLQSTLRRIYPMVFLNVISFFTLTLMQYLWLQSGSGNANFFFFQNLLFLFTQLFSLMECLGAVRRLQSLVMEGRIKETTRRRAKQILDGAAAAAAKNPASTPSSSSSSSSKKQQ